MCSTDVYLVKIPQSLSHILKETKPGEELGSVWVNKKDENFDISINENVATKIENELRKSSSKEKRKRDKLIEDDEKVKHISSTVPRQFKVSKKKKRNTQEIRAVFQEDTDKKIVGEIQGDYICRAENMLRFQGAYLKKAQAIAEKAIVTKQNTNINVRGKRYIKKKAMKDRRVRLDKDVLIQNIFNLFKK